VPRFLPALRGSNKGLALYATPFVEHLDTDTKAVVGQYLSRRSCRAVRAEQPRLVSGRSSAPSPRATSGSSGSSSPSTPSPGNVAALPFTLLDKASNEVEHPLVDLLNGAEANPFETGPELRERLSAQFLLSRRGVFVEVTMTRRSTPAARRPAAARPHRDHPR
jgi:hypothetical protein